MLAIVVPMAVEATGIRRALRRRPDAATTLHISGVGRHRITAVIAELANSPQRPDVIILAGCCGALDPTLNTGDVHIAPSFYYPGQDETIAADARLVVAIMNAGADSSDIKATSSPSVTVAAIAQPDAKANLRRYGATVNMEDYHAARAAASAGIPFAAIRAVLDTADESLPTYLALDAAVDNDDYNDADDNAAASNRSARIAAGLARHPTRLPELLRLQRQMLQTRRNLTRCVMAAVSAIQSPTPTAAAPAGAEAIR